MRVTIPGSDALGRRLKMQSSGRRSQQPLLGLKKPSPRLGFAHLDSYKTKPCDTELYRGLLAQLPALQALCWGSPEQSSVLQMAASERARELRASSGGAEVVVAGPGTSHPSLLGLP